MHRGLWCLCHIVQQEVKCASVTGWRLEEVTNRTPGLWEMTPAMTPLTLWAAQLVYGWVGEPRWGGSLQYKPITETGSDG